MTKITRLCLLAIILICNNIMATTESIALSNTYSSASTSMAIQRVRIDFTMPNGYIRHLLLGFTPNNAATDGYDYGYDAVNMDTFPDDLNWIIEEGRYVIQGVGAFENTKKYPLGLFLKNGGNIKIALDRTENFTSPIDVFLYDSILETYTKLNEESFDDTLAKGDYLNRFYIAFKSENVSSDPSAETNQFAKTSLSNEFPDIKNTRISYLMNSNELFIDAPEHINLTSVSLFNIAGQRILTSNLRSSGNKIKIAVNGTNLKHGIVTIESESGSVSKQIVLNSR